MTLVRSLGQQIAGKLRAEIHSGRFREGEQLREIELSKRFGTSRGPIRDALHELTKEGLLITQPRGGVAVAPAAGDEIRELVTPIRRTVETYALGLIFDRLNDDDFAHWQLLVDHMRLACQRVGYALVAESDTSFHRYILERSGEHCLLAIWSTIVAQLRRHFSEACRQYDDLLDYHAEHVALLEAFRSRDRRRATLALEEHILWPERQTASRSKTESTSS
jgi:GntR family transcriptional regulator, rspAB operon transcriptional repressor